MKFSNDDCRFILGRISVKCYYYSIHLCLDILPRKKDVSSKKVGNNTTIEKQKLKRKQ